MLMRQVRPLTLVASQRRELASCLVGVPFEERDDRTLGIASLVADPNRAKAVALGQTQHGLLVNAQQFRDLSRLVVLLEDLAASAGLVARRRPRRPVRDAVRVFGVGSDAPFEAGRGLSVWLAFATVCRIDDVRRISAVGTAGVSGGREAAGELFGESGREGVGGRRDRLALFDWARLGCGGCIQRVRWSVEGELDGSGAVA